MDTCAQCCCSLVFINVLTTLFILVLPKNNSEPWSRHQALQLHCNVLSHVGTAVQGGTDVNKGTKGRLPRGSRRKGTMALARLFRQYWEAQIKCLAGSWPPETQVQSTCLFPEVGLSYMEFTKSSVAWVMGCESENWEIANPFQKSVSTDCQVVSI